MKQGSAAVNSALDMRTQIDQSFWLVACMSDNYLAVVEEWHARTGGGRRTAGATIISYFMYCGMFTACNHIPLHGYESASFKGVRHVRLPED